MSIIDSIQIWLKERARRRVEERLLERDGCICYCPQCREPLAGSKCIKTGDGEYMYVCKSCETVSGWNFSAFPAPFLLYSSKPEQAP